MINGMIDRAEFVFCSIFFMVGDEFCWKLKF